MSYSRFSRLLAFQSRALACERGKVISMYISALSEFKKLEDFNFVSTLCELIAVRPHVCSDAFDRFPYLRALAITEITGTFEQAVESSHVSLAVQRDPAQSLVTITIPREAPESAQNGSVTHVVVSSNLLHAAIILISNWQRRDHDEDDAQNVEETSILHLLRYLVIPFTNEGDGNTLSGLSSAKHKHNKKGAVSVEEVSRFYFIWFSTHAYHLTSWCTFPSGCFSSKQEHR